MNAFCLTQRIHKIIIWMCNQYKNILNGIFYIFYITSSKSGVRFPFTAHLHSDKPSSRAPQPRVAIVLGGAALEQRVPEKVVCNHSHQENPENLNKKMNSWALFMTYQIISLGVALRDLHLLTAL